MFDRFTDLTEQQKEWLVAQALEHPEGRVALAQGMVEPIRQALEYQSVGRKCLMVDQLPQGAYARYERDPAAIAHILGKRQRVPDMITEGEELLVPTFEIAANPTTRLKEVRARRFYIIDRAQLKAKEAIQKEEDAVIFRTLTNAVDTRGTQIVDGSSQVTPDGLNEAFAYIEQHDLVPSRILMHPNNYMYMRTLGNDFYDQATRREILSSGLFG